MLYFGILLITLAMLVATAILGRRIADLLPTMLVPVGKFCFAPILGLAAVMLAATLHGWFRPFSLATTGVPMAIALALSLWYERDRQALIRDLLPAIALTVITSSTVLFPLLRFDTYNPFNDTFTYLVHSQWLQEHPFSQTAVHSGFYPALTQVSEYQSGAHRMGASFFLAFAQAVFGLKWSYYAYPAAVALALTAGSMAVGGTVKLIWPAGRLMVLLVAAATATMMNGFAFGSFFGFMPQTFGLAVGVGALGLYGALITAHQQPIRIKRLASETIPAALLFSALAYCYNDMLPFIAVGILLYVAGAMLFDRRQMPRLLLSLVVLTAETLILVNYETVHIVKNFLDTMLSVGGGAAVIGWPVRWSAAAFLAHSFGFKSPYDDVWLFVNPALTQIICALVFITVVIGVVSLIKQRQNIPTLGLFLGTISVFIMAFLHFRYNVAAVWPNDVGHSFLQFKTAKWASPFICVMTGATAAWLAYGTKGRRRRFGRMVEGAVAFVVVLAVSWNYVNVPKGTTQMLDETGYRTSSFDAFLNLRQLVADIPPNQPIYLALGAEHHKLRQMVAYILYDRRVASNYMDDGYLTGNIPPAEREMPRNVADWVLTMASAKDQTSKALPVIGNMELRSASANQFILDRVEGGYAQESQGVNAWRWTSGKIEYFYKVESNASNASTVRLNFTHLLAGPTRHIRVVITDADKKTLGSYEFDMQAGWSNFSSPPFSVAPGPVSVLIESNGEPIRLSQHDPRMASFLVQNIELQEEK
jgi:hypothetical protein